jgi:hypothetical protein
MLLVDVVMNAAAISKFVQQDLSTLLAELDMRAASLALSRVAMANDKRSAIWSVIPHLVSAEAKFEADMVTSHRFQAAQSLLYLHALRATILRDLGDEEAQVSDAFVCSQRVVAEQNAAAWRVANQVKDIVTAWNPSHWVRLYRYINSPLGQKARSFEASLFWERLGYTEGKFWLDVGPDSGP